MVMGLRDARDGVLTLMQGVSRERGQVAFA